MSWSVHLKDRKAAYHVPNRQATDICHLQSFISLLPASVPPNAHTRTHTHSVLLAQCPHFQSISATYLSHHSNCSLQHSSFLYGVRERKEWDEGERGKWRRRGWSVHLGGLICSERCCFGSKKLSSDTCPIDTLKRLPTQQKRWDDSPRLQIGRWECDVKDERAADVPLLSENSRHHLQPLSGLFYRFSSTSPSSSSMSPTLSAPPPSSLFTQASLIFVILIVPQASEVFSCTNTLIIIINIEWLKEIGGLMMQYCMFQILMLKMLETRVV